MSVDDIHSDDTENNLGKLIRILKASSQNIVIEATERGIMFPEKARDNLISIRAGGFKVAIDDFGTGNSSLSYLSTYDLDLLKIDKSFVDELAGPHGRPAVLLHIIDMARSLGLQMIAEGVEIERQRDALRDLGVDFAQGWLFGKPMPMRDLHEFIRVHQRA